MRISVSLTSSFPRTLDPREAGQQIIERARAARAAGLHGVYLGDDHATRSHYFQNVPTLARLLAEIDDTAAGALFLAPLWPPALLAEQVGTLAVLARGRFVLILAAGDGEEQFAPFGVSLRQRPGRLEEQLQIVPRLLEGETLSFPGRYYKLENLRINPVPPEGVDLWVAASGRPALERAGRRADAWLASPGAYGEELQTQANIYRAAADAANRPYRCIVRRDIYVGESDGEAADTVGPLLAGGYRGIRREALIVGGPDSVLDAFRDLEHQGFEEVVIRHIVHDQDQVLASYRRLGEHVVPRAG
jgi:alkanesulfonate monooxygenase SsuD/methylene tetrahydromethanopterin reductase-like flavin-dependent oxidoreductase (luciferase family)